MIKEAQIISASSLQERSHTGQFETSPFEILRINTWKEFLNLEHTWKELLDQLQSKNLFTTFEWMSTWWQCLGKDKDLLIFVIKTGEKIIGIAPLMKVRRTTARFPTEEIYFISATQSAYSPSAYSGTLDLLFHPDYMHLLEAFVRYLLVNLKGWNYFRLHPIPEDSSTISVFIKVANELGMDIQAKHVFKNACLAIFQDWDIYFVERTATFRQNLKRAYRKLTEKHKIEFVEYRSSPQINESLSHILDIEQKSWKWQSGVRINEDGTNNFYFELAKKLSDKGWVRIWMLKVDGKPIAYDYHIEFENHIKTLKGSYDASFAKYSPGMLLAWHAHERFFHERIQQVDLLWGNLDYKQKWTNRLVPHWGVCIKNIDRYTRFLDACENSQILNKMSKKFRELQTFLR